MTFAACLFALVTFGSASMVLPALADAAPGAGGSTTPIPPTAEQKAAIDQAKQENGTATPKECTSDAACNDPKKICDFRTQTCVDKPAEPAVGIPTLPGGSGTIPEIIGRVIKGALGLSGVIALLMFVWGGASYMLAAGNSEKIEKAKQTMVWAALGLIAIFGSYGIVSALIKTVQTGSPGSASSSPSTPTGTQGQCEQLCFNLPKDQQSSCLSDCATQFPTSSKF